jgi:drug/metabolite transporter (DMT)-like permease
MDNNDLRARAPGQGVMAHRSEPFAAEGRASWLTVASVALAIAGAVMAVASSPDHLVSMVFGLGLFVAGAGIAVASAASLTRTVTGATRLSQQATSRDLAQDAATGVYGAFASMQLGPDPEQVIGRQTGART